MPLLYSRKSGRLCNGLFPLANLLSYAISSGDGVAAPAFLPYAEDFLEFAPNKIPKAGKANKRTLVELVGSSAFTWDLFANPCRKIGWLNEHYISSDTILNLSCTEEKIIRDSQAGETVAIHGTYLMHDATCIDNADQIRQVLRPTQTISASIDKHMVSLRDSCDIVVGIHIRHGDYAEHLGGAYYYTLDEYKKLMRSITKLFPGERVSFLVCSNEPQDFSDCSDLAVKLGPGARTADLYALARCDFLVGTLSTFSQWASFYGDTPLLQLPNRNDADLFNSVLRCLTLDHFRSLTWGYGLHTRWNQAPITQPSSRN